MIIVSQGKDNIVNFNNIINLWINNPLDNPEGFEINTDSENLGIYKTEERSKEVLQEIVNTYVRECKTYIMPED